MLRSIWALSAVLLLSGCLELDPARVNRLLDQAEELLDELQGAVATQDTVDDPDAPVRFGVQRHLDGSISAWHRSDAGLSDAPLANTPFGTSLCADDDTTCIYGPWAQKKTELEAEFEALRWLELTTCPGSGGGSGMTAMLSCVPPWDICSGMHPEGHPEWEACVARIRLQIENDLRARAHKMQWLQGELARIEGLARERQEAHRLRPIWTGSLLGFAPSGGTVTGDARLQVDLDSLTGTLDFDSLSLGSGAMWHDGDLSYDVRVAYDAFESVGGDDGDVAGRFYGPQHQAMGGTLERTDLTAAFGGRR